MVLVTAKKSEDIFNLSFRDGGVPGAANLSTVLGNVRLYIAQTCQAVSTSKRPPQFRLQTVRYRYALGTEDSEEPFIRWEYVKNWKDPYCRHHVQGPVDVRVGTRTLNLNDVHLPTGFVTIEEIIRFCIVDLRVKPLSDDWDRELRESYRTFKTKFAPRGPDAT